MQTILESGQDISPILFAPHVTIDIFRIDWLHCADQGITADYLGNMFRLLVSKCRGGNIQERTAALWDLVQKYYKEEQVQDRLQNLTHLMIKQSKKAPKLRCSAAQCRALVPFAVKAAQELLDSAVPLEEAAKTGMYHLDQCYRALSHDSIFAADVLKEHSTKFALIFCSLEEYTGDDPKAWRIKPKLHLFLHLCAGDSRPTSCWTYRDEDYGGSVSSRSRRRGGVLSVAAFSANLLNRFRMQPMVRMLVA